MSSPEKQHIIDAFSFEVEKVSSGNVKQQVVDMFVNVDKEMATTIEMNVGLNKPAGEQWTVTEFSPALSQEHTNRFLYSLKVGVVIGDGFNDKEVMSTIEHLAKDGVWVYTIGEKIGTVKGEKGLEVHVSETFSTTAPVLFDSLYIVGGKALNQVKFNPESIYFMNESFRHYKPIGIASTGNSLFIASDAKEGMGIIRAENNREFSQEFLTAITRQRFWDRQIY